MKISSNYPIVLDQNRNQTQLKQAFKGYMTVDLKTIAQNIAPNMEKSKACEHIATKIKNEIGKGFFFKQYTFEGGNYSQQVFAGYNADNIIIGTWNPAIYKGQLEAIDEMIFAQVVNLLNRLKMLQPENAIKKWKSKDDAGEITEIGNTVRIKIKDEPGKPAYYNEYNKNGEFIKTTKV